MVFIDETGEERERQRGRVEVTSSGGRREGKELVRSSLQEQERREREREEARGGGGIWGVHGGI